MQRLDLPPLVWHLMDPVAATTANDAAPAAPGLPQWQVGQLLVGQVLENLDGQVLALIDGHRLRADWPGPQQVPGARVAFRVVGQAAGQWRLAVVADEQFSEVGSDGILSASSSCVRPILAFGSSCLGANPDSCPPSFSPGSLLSVASLWRKRVRAEGQSTKRWLL